MGEGSRCTTRATLVHRPAQASSCFPRPRRPRSLRQQRSDCSCDVTALQSTSAGHTTPPSASAAPVRKYRPRHHAYAPEGEEEEECNELRAAALAEPSAAVPTSRSAPVPQDAHVPRARGTGPADMAGDDFLCSHGRRRSSPARDGHLIRSPRSLW